MTSLPTGYGKSLCYAAALDLARIHQQHTVFITDATLFTGTRHLKYGMQSLYFLGSRSRNCAIRVRTHGGRGAHGTLREVTLVRVAPV